MERLRELWRRLLYLLRRSQMEQDLAEEMRLHLDLRSADNVAGGMGARDAASSARRKFGNVTQLRERGGEAWGWSWLDSLAQDVRYGLRTLLSNPGFTITAILSLALGIGANTAIFSIVNAVMLRSLPVEDPHRLVQVKMGFDTFTNPIWEHVRDHQQAFSGALAFSTDRFNLANGGESRFAEGLWVSGDFFRVLGVPALRGRIFTNDDDEHGGGRSGPVAVISYGFWKTSFGGDPDVVGKTVRLNRHTFQIVGVTPPWFRGLDIDRGFDVAIPIGCEPILHTDRSALNHRSWWWLRILGRVAPGSTIEQAEAKMKAISAEVNRATLPPNWEPRDKEEYLRRSFQLRPAATGFSETGSQYRKALLTLMAVVALVLLIACANIANLLLSRAAARHREISIRLAIGAGRWRVVRQLLTESLLLALFGALCGLLFARWGSALLVHLLSTTRSPLEIDVSPDASVLLFTTGVAILTGMLFGLAPALRATRVQANQVLKESARAVIQGSTRFRLGKLLVAGQVALSLVLLVGAGLFLNTMRNLMSVPTGFDQHGVLLVRTDTLGQVAKEQRLQTSQDILDRIRRLPGVTAAASSFITPISRFTWNDFTHPEGFAAKSREDTETFFNRVSPDYFRTMGTPLLLGRDFNESDTLRSAKVMIINESAARHFFGGSSAIGKTIGVEVIDKPGTRDNYQVIGVVQDAKYIDLREDIKRTAYLPIAQDPMLPADSNFEIRSTGTLGELTASVRAAVAEINKGISVEFRSFEAQVGESLLQERVVALLSGFFGALALLLAMIGLYGVTSYAVARRRGEIGIRMALGASQESVMWLVLKDIAVMLAAGSVLGFAASLAAGRLVASLLYGLKPHDPVTLAGAVAVLSVATAVAGYFPALRAARVDPAAALRDE